MSVNSEPLRDLFEEHRIDIRRGAVFDSPPIPVPLNFDFERVEGIMLGLAIGDSIGNTTEGMLPRRRGALYGEIRDYQRNHHVDNLAVGLPSDDTQFAFWTLEQMLEDEGFVPEHLADKFTSDRIYGGGSTTAAFVHAYTSGESWDSAGQKRASNGAQMRIAPMLIPHLRSGTTDLWVDTALSAMMTHNDSASISACLSFVNVLWQLLQMDVAPDPLWWLDTYVETAKGLEADESYRPRGGDFLDYQGPLWQFVEEKVGDAYNSGLSALDACDRWYSGAYLFETMPSAIYILMKHSEDLEQAIVRAVNDTKDNDTIAAIVGAAVGALHGRKAIPDRWLSRLTGRVTRQSEDGVIFRLLEEAKGLWWH